MKDDPATIEEILSAAVALFCKDNPNEDQRNLELEKLAKQVLDALGSIPPYKVFVAICYIRDQMADNFNNLSVESERPEKIWTH